MSICSLNSLNFCPFSIKTHETLPLWLMFKWSQMLCACSMWYCINIYYLNRCTYVSLYIIFRNHLIKKKKFFFGSCVFVHFCRSKIRTSYIFLVGFNFDVSLVFSTINFYFILLFNLVSFFFFFFMIILSNSVRL